MAARGVLPNPLTYEHFYYAVYVGRDQPDFTVDWYVAADADCELYLFQKTSVYGSMNFKEWVCVYPVVAEPKDIRYYIAAVKGILPPEVGN